MNDILNLKKIYSSPNSIKFKNDISNCKNIIIDIKNIFNKSILNYQDIEYFLLLSNKFLLLYNQLLAYIQLNIYINTDNIFQYKNFKNTILSLYNDFQICENLFSKSVFTDNLQSLCKKSSLINEHINYIYNLIKKNNKNNFNNNSVIFEDRYSNIISKLQIYYKNKNYSLTESEKKMLTLEKEEERKALYIEREKALSNIAKDISYCLINIKKETLHISKKQGFETPLDMALNNINFDKKVLNNLIKSIEKHLTIFHKYLDFKAQYMKNHNGLNYYNINYPIININLPKFNIDKTESNLIKIFDNYSESLSHLTYNLFHNHFIDYKNRLNKSSISCHIKILNLKESRIICHEKNSIKDLFEIGHEIGHAYHGYCIMKTESAINSEIPLYLSEINSLFCELLIYNNLFQKSTKKEKICLLDMFLSYATYAIVEIYSRFLFEYELFHMLETNKEISSKEISNLMISTQKQAFKNSINPNFIDKYLWIYKPHFYSVNDCFYNFPYALGLLYAIKLFEIYKHTNSKQFKLNFDNFLRLSGRNDFDHLSKIFNINIFDPNCFETAFLKINDLINELIILFN